MKPLEAGLLLLIAAGAAERKTKAVADDGDDKAPTKR